MDALRMLAFACVAAIGNALFALAQRQLRPFRNGLFLVACGALVACVFSILTASWVGPLNDLLTVRQHWKAVILSGTGLFFTYVGFYFLYTRFGAAPYGVYASMSIITTTVGVGFWYQGQRLTPYDILAIIFSFAAIILFSIAQWRR